MDIICKCGLPSIEELKKQIMLTVDVAWLNKLDEGTIEGWLSNFTGEALGSAEVERNLAMWLLYNFVYYNEDEIKHLCKLMLRKYIHEIIPRDNEKLSLDDITKIIENSLFLSIGNNSESGAYVLYLFRQENDLPVRSFNSEESKFSKTENIVFIDDMTLSGTQAKTRLEKIKYDGAFIKRNDIKDTFVNKLLDSRSGSLEEYIKYKLKSKIDLTEDNQTNISEELEWAMNDNIIKHKKLSEEIIKYFNQEKLPENIIKLIEYKKEGQLCNEGIFKLNRLLLEEYFPNDIIRGVDNICIDSWYLLTFFASEKAISDLDKIGVKVITCIKVDDQAKAFSQSSMIFSNYPSLKEPCKKMCRHYGEKIHPKHPLGYKEGAYTFGLYYTTPNNSLPIFWVSSNWKPLFIRHQKNYGGVIDVFGRYV